MARIARRAYRLTGIDWHRPADGKTGHAAEVRPESANRMTTVFPRGLLALTDAQLEIVMAAAAPLQQPGARSSFLEAVAARLAGAGELGDGAVSRCCRELQREYFTPPDLYRA